jgi:hypothetical protein
VGVDFFDSVAGVPDRLISQELGLYFGGLLRLFEDEGPAIIGEVNDRCLMVSELVDAEAACVAEVVEVALAGLIDQIIMGNSDQRLFFKVEDADGLVFG